MAVESEEKDSYSLKTNEKIVIDTIRRKINKKEIISSKNTISEITQIPWATVSNIFKSLHKKGILHIMPSRDSKKEEIYSLNPKYGYFVGISLGTSRIKISILDYCFNTLKINESEMEELKNIQSEYNDVIQEIVDELKGASLEWKICCNKQCATLIQFVPVVSAIVDIICFLKTKLNINILAISFVFPGSIDYKNKIITDSYVLEGMSNITIAKFLTKRNIHILEESGIAYSIDHNAKAAIIAEKEIGGIWDPFDNEENLMCLYLGYGIGAAYILGNELYRGNRNESGQIGHNQVIPRLLNEDLSINPAVNYEHRCRCQRINCLEHRIREDVFGTDFDIKIQSVEEAKAFLQGQGEQLRLRLFSQYLGETLCNNLDNLSIDKIIFSGKFAGLFDLFENELNQILLMNKKSNVILQKSELGEFSAAMGAAIEGYNCFK